jgi:hypothetical protein
MIFKNKKSKPKAGSRDDGKREEVPESWAVRRGDDSRFSTSDTPIPPTVHDRQLETDLHRIYDEHGAAAPDMTRLDIVHHSTVKKILVVMTVFFAMLAAISWAGVLFFSPGAGSFSGNDVKVDIGGPTEVKSGDPVTYTVHYVNGEHVALGTSSLELRMPKEFTMQSSDPPVQGGDVWQIGSLAPGHDGTITVKGVILAPTGTALDVQAILTYRPADFNSDFQKVSTAAVTVGSSVLDLQVSGPPKVLPGDVVSIVYTYKNNSDSPFENLEVRAEYPPNFIPASSVPPAAGSDLTSWDIPTLGAGQSGTITVQGSFASDAEGSIDVKGQVGLMNDDGTFALQQESTFTTDVIKGDLVTSLILNGNPGNQPVMFGDTLHYAVTYKNTGTAVLGNVSLAASFVTVPADGVLDWNKLSDKAGGTLVGNTVTWTKKQIPSLAQINPGDSGTIDFDIPFLAAPISGVQNGDFEVSALVAATIDTVDGTQVGRVAETAPVVAKAVSDTQLTAAARYFNEDGSAAGSGPLPPEVGQKTTYRVTMTLTNSLHELTDLRISAKLPLNVTWTGVSNVDAGDITFDAADDQMVWTLNRMPTIVPSLNVSFDAAITPTAAQQGTSPQLVSGVIFEATDSLNGFPMLLAAPPITTSLGNDPNAAGKGQVQ